MPSDLTVGQFVYVIRKRIKLSPEKAIFIFVDEVLPPTAALMSSIYEEHKDEDGYVFSPPAFHNVIPLYRSVIVSIAINHQIITQRNPTQRNATSIDEQRKDRDAMIYETDMGMRDAC